MSIKYIEEPISKVKGNSSIIISSRGYYTEELRRIVTEESLIKVKERIRVLRTSYTVIQNKDLTHIVYIDTEDIVNIIVKLLRYTDTKSIAVSRTATKLTQEGIERMSIRLDEVIPRRDFILKVYM